MSSSEFWFCEILQTLRARDESNEAWAYACVYFFVHLSTVSLNFTYLYRFKMRIMKDFKMVASE